MIMGLRVRHKLSKTLLGDILNLVNFHLPVGVSVPTSVYLLEKSLGINYTDTSKIPYCRKCEHLIQENESECSNCEEKQTRATAIQEGHFFMSFNIQQMLNNVLQQLNVQESLLRNLSKRSNIPANSYSSIMDGVMYKRLNLSKMDFTCSVNTDGVAVFNSSKFSIWPLLYLLTN